MTNAPIDPWLQPDAVTEFSVNLNHEPDFDFSRLQAFQNLTNLYVGNIQKLGRCIKTLAEVVPHLTQLSLQCNHRDLQIIPPVMGRFTQLEELSLGYCTVPSFPEEMGALIRLRIFHTYSVSMHPFPEFLTQLPVLEDLQLASGGIDKLPESFAKIHSLKYLTLSGGFGNGYKGARQETERDLALIARLPSLESLWMNDCGVITLNGMERMDNLRDLNLSTNLFSDLEPLRGLQALERLLIDGLDSPVTGQGGARVRDLSPLGDLVHLTKLDISDWSTWRHDFTLDLSPLAGCRALRELNCEGTDVVGLSALKPLPLRTVELHDPYASAWRKIQKTPRIPVPEVCRQHLRSEDLSKQRRGLRDAAILLGVEPELQVVPEAELRPILIRCLPDLPEKDLKEFLAATYRTSSDHSSLTIPVVEEMLRRGTSALENTIVEVFLKAHKDYDGGHRSSGESVQNHLMDACLPRLSTPALIKLLDKLKFDMLNASWGDGLEELFVAALSRPTARTEQEVLLKRLNLHLKIHHAQFPEDAEALIQRIEPLLDPDLRKRIRRAPKTPS